MALDYEQDIRIDADALDLEWLDQPRLMLRYSKELAKAEREQNRLKEKLAVTEAQLDRDVRLTPGDYIPMDPKTGTPKFKITEAVVRGCVIQDDDYKEVHEELIQAQFEVKVLKGAVDAIQQRKDALQDLVRLHGQNYFAGPKVPRDLAKEVASRETQQAYNRKKSNEAVSRKRRRNN